jgi:hypothetical protein
MQALSPVEDIPKMRITGQRLNRVLSSVPERTKDQSMFVILTLRGSMVGANKPPNVLDQQPTWPSLNPFDG